MREIKFRAWDKRFNEMVDVARIDWNENLEVILVAYQSAVNFDHEEGGFGKQ